MKLIGNKQINMFAVTSKVVVFYESRKKVKYKTVEFEHSKSCNTDEIISIALEQFLNQFKKRKPTVKEYKVLSTKNNLLML